MKTQKTTLHCCTRFLIVLCLIPFFLANKGIAQSCVLPSISSVIVPTCESASDGSIDITVTGSGTYTYLWMPGGQTTQDISDLTDGIYEVKITIDGDSSCSITEAFLVEENASPFANAGLDKNQCQNGNFIMTAVAPAEGDGLWTVIGNPNGATITTPSSNTTSVTGLNIGMSTTLLWTITNDNCTDQDEIRITNDIQTNANAGDDQEQCNNGDFTLSATTPLFGTGSWSIVGVPNGANITDASAHNSTVTGLNEGASVTLRWIVNNGTCFDVDDITLTNSSSVFSEAGADQINCNSDAFTLSGNNPFIGSGEWSIIGEANGAIVSNSNIYNSMVSGLSAGKSAVLRWTVSNAGCTTFDDVMLTNDNPLNADAGDDLENCNSGTFILHASEPQVGSGSWSIIGPPGGAIISSPSSPTSMVTGLNNGFSVTLRWSVFNGTCFDMDEVVLSNDIEVFAFVAPDQNQCDNGNFNLLANSPTIGSGEWSFDGLPISAEISTPSSPTSAVTDVQPDETVSLKWTTTNGGCSASDVVSITNDALFSANAGPDMYKCNNGDFKMDGNLPPASGAGFWQIIGTPNGASIINPTDPQTDVLGLNINHSTQLTWTLINGNCISSDTIEIFHSAPVVAHAGSNQEKCTIGDFTMAANNPVIGTGKWTFIGESYNAQIENDQAHNTAVSGLLLRQSITLRWTVTNGGCQEFEDVRLTNDPPVESEAGANQEKCNNGSFTLSANDPTEGYGIWSIVGNTNGALIDNVTVYNSEVTELEIGQSIVLRWTVTNGGCELSDDVTLTNFQSVLSQAGGDQTNCSNGSFTLSANEAQVGNGQWSIQGPANNAKILDPTAHNSNVIDLSAGSSTILRWTVTNGTCTKFDEVILTNDQSVDANAGLDQRQCNNASFTLAAIDPLVGHGSWSIIGDSHGTVINDMNQNSSSVTGLLPGHSVVCRWTVSNGTCTEFDDVILTNDQMVNSNAGDDQNKCATGTFQLNASPPGIGIGAWSFIGNNHGAQISQINNHDATLSNLTAGRTATLRWTVSNETCESIDDVIISNNEDVSSSSGTNQSKCNDGDFTLNASTPDVGEGLWSIIGVSNGALISEPSEPHSSVIGLNPGGSVELEWKVTNSSCVASETVVLRNDESVIANAGPDQYNCDNDHFVLEGNTSNPGNGQWTISGSSNGAAITNPFDPSTTVEGLIAGQSITLRWTIVNGSCTDYDEVLLFNEEMVTAIAGPDQRKCHDGQFVLNADNPTIGNGRWTIIGASNGASIDDPMAYNTSVQGVMPNQSVVLRWTVINNTCEIYDELSLYNDELIVAVAGDSQLQCDNGSFVLSANNPTLGSGLWSIIGSSNGATINNSEQHNTAVTGLEAGKSITLRWTITNNACSAYDELQLINYESVEALAGTDITQCNDSQFILDGNAPIIGNGNWTFIGNSHSASIVDASDPKSEVINVPEGQSVVLRWTITNEVCEDYDEVQLSNDISTILCPTDILTPACLSQLEIENSFSSWKMAFEGQTNMAGSISYSIEQNGIITNGVNSLENLLAPDNTGGEIIVTMEVSCAQTFTSCTSKFKVGAATPLSSTSPPPIIKNQCDDADDFESWKDAFLASGGCNSVVTYDVVIVDSTNNETFLTDLTDIDNIQAPSPCGGSVEILIRIKSDFGLSSGQSNEHVSSSSYSIENPNIIMTYGPSDLEVDTMSTQIVIDSLFQLWLSEFGFTGGVCGEIEQTNTDLFNPPAYTSGITTVNYVVHDECSLDSMESSFSVPPFALVPQSIILSGPEVVCASNDGFTFQVDTLEGNFNLNWTFTGIGGIVTDQTDNTLEMGFEANATNGYLIVEVDDSFTVVKDSLYITIGDELICNIHCQGILEITEFMMNNSTAPDSIDYWAEFIIYSDGLVRSESNITFNAGLSIDLKPNFNVAPGGEFEANIDHCDGIGFTDTRTYDAVLSKVKEKIKGEK